MTTLAIGLALCCLFLVAAFVLWRLAEGRRRATGLPRGRVAHADTGDWRTLERPLISRRYRLVGRPDYLVEHKGQLIPVEVKSRWAPRSPYSSHVLQLGAYCLLVEEYYGQIPSHGILHYRDATFEIPYTSDLREQVVATLTAIQQDRHAEDVPCSNDDRRRCASCGYQKVCDQAMR